MESIKRLLQSLNPDPIYQGVIVALLVVVVLLTISLFVSRLRTQRANLGLSTVIAALLLVLVVVDSNHRWQWIVGLLPTLLVGYQAFFLWLYHPKKIENRGGGTRAMSSLQAYSEKRAQDSISSHFGLKTLFVRYGLPAVLLGLAGIILVDILVEPARYFSLMEAISDGNRDLILPGIRLGAVGAFIYVLLELGRRTFRHDVTGASAMWCFVTLVLGPVLAATVAVLWRMKEPQASEWWAGGIVLFFAGFAPRRVISAIEQAALQLLKVGSQPVVETRLIPLNKVRGISPQIEERLSEEGIVDVNSLATAEPVRLVRNTAFDMRQILTWIDEAILIVTLPKSWEAFEEEGITGATDLVWYYHQLFEHDGSLKKPVQETTIPALAEKGKIDAPNLLSTIQRLYEDAQVQYICALSTSFTEFSGGQALPANGVGHHSSGEPVLTTST